MEVLESRIKFLENLPMGVTYRLDNPVLVSESGVERRNASKTQPLAEFTINAGFITKHELDKLIEVYQACEGKRKAFLFKDPIDNSITKSKKDTGLGVYTQGQLLLDNNTNKKYLTKLYAVKQNPNSFVVRPRVITYPDQSKLTPLGIEIKRGTGEILAGGNNQLPDELGFYTPVIFADESINYSFINKQDPCGAYAQLNSIRLQEVLDDCDASLPWANIETPYFSSHEL